MRDRLYLSGLSFLFSFLSVSFLHSDYRSSLDSAIDDLYNFRFDSSIQTVEELSAEFPEDPILPFMRISLHWQQSLFNQNPESSYSVIEQGIEELVPFYLDMIDRYPENQRYNLFLGSLYGLKARIDLAQSMWMDLLLSGAKGYSYIDKARKLDPLLHDVNMPIGTLEYFLCRSASPIQFVGKIFGLGADCKEAIDKLEIASDSGEFSYVESDNVLSYIYLYIEKDYSSALMVTSKLVDRYPGHPFFAYLKAETLLKLKRYSEFEKMESSLIEFTTSGPKNQRIECQDKYLYLLSLRSFQEGDYSDAIKQASAVIEGYETEFKWVLGYSHLIRGKSLEYTGNRRDAISDYRIASDYLENYPEKEEADALIYSPIDAAGQNK